VRPRRAAASWTPLLPGLVTRPLGPISRLPELIGLPKLSATDPAALDEGARAWRGLVIGMGAAEIEKVQTALDFEHLSFSSSRRRHEVARDRDSAGGTEHRDQHDFPLGRAHAGVNGVDASKRPGDDADGVARTIMAARRRRRRQADKAVGVAAGA
jgi:hypothetical protein